MLDSTALHNFSLLARRLHFGRAADELGIAQSALSRQLKQLEDSLGARLLIRGRRSTIALTDAGRTLLEQGALALEHLERAVVATQRASRGQVGQIKIGYVVSASLTGVLPNALRTFRQTREHVEISLNPMDTPSQLAALRQGSIDVGFLRPRASYPEGVSATVIHTESMMLALASGHPLSSERIEPGMLAGETFIVPQFDESAGFAAQLTALGVAGNFTPTHVHRVRDFLTAVTLAAAGYGVVYAPKSWMSITLANIGYRAIHRHEAHASLAVAFRSSNPAEAARRFIDQVSRPKRRTASARSTD